MRCSVIVGVIMLLKTYLKNLYGLSEEYVISHPDFKSLIPSVSKCSKFVIGKKTAIGDKVTNKRHQDMISWNRLHFATVPLVTMNDVELQKRQVILSFSKISHLNSIVSCNSFLTSGMKMEYVQNLRMMWDE